MSDAVVCSLCRMEVLGMSSGIDADTHLIKWDLALCLLLAWIFIFFCTAKGIKSSGKVGELEAFQKRYYSLIQ